MRPLFGAKIRRLRRESGLTQVELAHALGISPSYMNLIEHDRRSVNPAHLPRLAEALGVDVQALFEGEEARIAGELADMLDDPLFAGRELTPGVLSALAGSAPEVGSALAALYRAYRTARDDVHRLSDRLADDPFLADSIHQLLTLLTSIRSSAEILQDNADLAATSRQQFVDILVDETRRLTDLVTRVFQFIGQDGLREASLVESPEDEVEGVLHARNNHFPELEGAADRVRRKVGLAPGSGPERLARFLSKHYGVELGVLAPETAAAGLERFDADAGRLRLSEALPPSGRAFRIAARIGQLACADAIDDLVVEAALSGDGARQLLRRALGNYFAGALLMPYETFRDSAHDLRHDIECLQRRFGVSFEQACHRLTTLRRSGAEGVPFHFLKVDIAGNVRKRYAGSGLRLPRHGPGCGRWNVYTAFLNPGRIDVQLARLPDGAAYVCIACALARPESGYGRPKAHHAVAIGCELAFARQLVYADALNLDNDDIAVPVGITCRQCARPDCRQRSAPAAVPAFGSGADPAMVMEGGAR